MSSTATRTKLPTSPTYGHLPATSRRATPIGNWSRRKPDNSGGDGAAPAFREARGCRARRTHADLERVRRGGWAAEDGGYAARAASLERAGGLGGRRSRGLVRGLREKLRAVPRQQGAARGPPD